MRPIKPFKWAKEEEQDMEHFTQINTRQSTPSIDNTEVEGNMQPMPKYKKTIAENYLNITLKRKITVEYFKTKNYLYINIY